MTMLQSPTTPTPTSESKPRFKGKSGAQIFHELLIQQHKVEVMFGYPGGAILPVFDQLYRTPAKFILNRHEQASGHCADGYARITGKPGICIVTSGPAATNTICPEEVDDTPRLHIVRKRAAANTHPNHANQAEAAAEAINRSSKPVLYVGGGAIIAGAHEALRKIAEKGNIPVTTTLLGL